MKIKTILLLVMLLSSCAKMKQIGSNLSHDDSSMLCCTHPESTTTLLVDSMSVIVNTNKINHGKMIQPLHVAFVVKGRKKKIPSLENLQAATTSVLRSAAKSPLNAPDENADTAMYVGIMALIGALCGFLMISNPGEWIYLGFILFIFSPFEALIAIICGLVVFDKTKELPKDYLPGRRMAAIGIAFGLLAGALLMLFFNEHPDLFGF